jgi:hypothetical protein
MHRPCRALPRRDASRRLVRHHRVTIFSPPPGTRAAVAVLLRCSYNASTISA